MATITLQTISTATVKELKLFCQENNIETNHGEDRRRKATWLNAVEAWLIEGGAMEEIASRVDEANGVIPSSTPTYFTQSEHFTCAYPAQRVEDFIDLASYAPVATEQPTVSPVSHETATKPSRELEPVESQLSFNQSTTALLPMTLVLWTLALVIVPVMIALGWLGNGVVKLVRKVIPLMDVALVKLLGWLTWLSAYLFGDDDELNNGYEQVKNLMKTT